MSNTTSQLTLRLRWAAGVVLFASLFAARGQDRPQQQLDSLGEPLPPRAVQRLGSFPPKDEVPAEVVLLDSLREVRFAPDGRLIAVRGESGTPGARRHVDVWNTVTGRRLHAFETRDLPAAALGFSSDGSLLISETPQDVQGVQIWSLAQNKEIATTYGGRGRLSVSRTDRTVSVVTPFGRSDTVRVLRLESGEEIQRFVIDVLHRFEFSPDGRSLLAVKSAGDTTVRLIEIASNRPLQKLEGLPGEPDLLAFAPDGRTLAASGSRRTGLDKTEHHLLVWEASSGGVVHHLTPPARVLSLAISRDNRWLALGCADRLIRIYEIATGRPAGELEGHRGPVSTLDFSLANDRLASGSLDRTVLIWDVVEGFQTHLLTGPLGEKDRESLWSELAAVSPTPAYRALGQIQATPAETTSFLHARVRELLVPVESERIRLLIAQLKDADYRLRNRSTEELIKIREIARPLLMKEFKETGSEEVRYRIRRILGGAEPQERFNAADRRRLLRIIHALASIDLPDAAATLELIAKEFPEEGVAAAAREALKRRGAGG